MTTPPALSTSWLVRTLDSAAFAQAAADRGYVTKQTFDYDTTQHGAEVTGEPIVGKFGGTWEYNGLSRDATAGQYWDGAQWVYWPGCGGAGS